MGRSVPLFIPFFIGVLLLVCLPALGQATRPAGNHPDDPKPNLARKVPQVNVNGVPLDQAIDFFRDVSGLNVNVDWHALELLNVTKQTPISLKLSDVTLRRVLRSILDEAGGAGQTLTYYVEDGIIEITSRDVADHEMVTRVYPVDDLVMLVPDFVPPGLNLQSQSNQTSGQGGGGSSGGQSIFGGTGSQQQDTAASKAQRADDLVKTIMGSVRPDIWRENGGTATIRYFNGHIIVTAPRSVQDALSHQPSDA